MLVEQPVFQAVNLSIAITVTIRILVSVYAGSVVPHTALSLQSNKEEASLSFTDAGGEEGVGGGGREPVREESEVGTLRVERCIISNC